MFLEFNSIIIDPFNKNIDITPLKNIPGVEISDEWKINSEGASEIRIYGLCMFNPWIADFCIQNGILTKDMKHFLPLEKKINILELMFLLSCMEKAAPEQKERMKRFLEQEGQNIIGK